MSIQYIGARYVPKLFESPNGGAAWVPNVAYEALTIVTYANNSYTSRIPVPASVGSPNENPHYWVSTGVYNAYVETLRQEVSELSSDVDEVSGDLNTLENTVSGINTDYTAFKKKFYRIDSDARKVLFIGDSFAQGWTPDGTFTGWPVRVIDILGLTNAVHREYGGAGFVNTVDGHNFGNLGDDVTDKESFTDIVIAGGRNDATQPIANVKTAAKAAIAHYRSTFPNAVIHIGMICYSWESNVNCWYPYTAYREAAYETGAHYIDGSELAITNMTQMASDKKHPLDAGLAAIAQGIASGLAYDSFEAVGSNSFTANTNGFTGNGYGKQTNEMVNLIWTAIAGRNIDVAMTAGSTLSLKIGTHNIAVRFGSGYKYFTVPAVIGYIWNETHYYTTIPAQLQLTVNGDVNLVFKATMYTNISWIQGTLDYVDIPGGSALISVWD